MTKKAWQLDHPSPAPGQPVTNQSENGPADTRPSQGGDDWKKTDYPDKLKDSVLLPTEASFQRPPSNLDIEDEQVKLKYPRSVFFIVINEFCERFTYYGLRTILSIYFISNLMYSEDKATVMYHAFAMLCYFFPVIGGIVADSLLGKYRTIFYLSIVYAVGSILISVASAGLGSSGIEEPLALLGLLLIAVGTGGIKPCVSAFGGDQFKLPEQRLQLQRFFSIFYFSINAGSLISSFITPIFRQDVKCLGQESCYPLAFGVPAIVMVVSLVVFVCGRSMYKMNPPKGNIVVQVCSCIGSAISNKVKRSSTSTKQHRWIDYADTKYDKELRDDIMSVLRVLVLFLPLPVFWALFDQQGSRWTFQSLNMNGRIGPTVLKPDQMQVANPILILIFLPIMETCIYPILTRMRLLRKPLQRITAGGILACVAFIISAVLEWQLEKHYPVPLTNDLAQVRIFNLAPCRLHLTSDSFSPLDLDPMEMDAQLALKAIEGPTFKVNVSGSCIPNDTLALPMVAKTSKSVYLYKNNNKIVFSPAPDADTVVKKSDVNPVVRFVSIFGKNGTHKLELWQDGKAQLTVNTNTSFGATAELKVPVGAYSVRVDGSELVRDIMLDVSGTYSLLVNETFFQSIEVMEHNTIHMMWLLPQYAVITMAEVMFSVTGLEFAFTQAPERMTSVLTSAWHLTVAFGNLIVLVVAEAQFFQSHAWEFIMFAGLMLVDMFIFILIAIRYKYRNNTVSSSGSEATFETTTNSRADLPSSNGQDATDKRKE